MSIKYLYSAKVEGRRSNLRRWRVGDWSW